MTHRTSISVQYMTRIAILSAMAAILFLIEIPVVAFYKLDLSNVPVLIGAFSMGTVPGLVILLIKSLTGMLHSSSMFVGELADFLMGAALMIPASIMYARNKNRKTAAIGMTLGTLCMTVAGVLLNEFVLIPFYINAFGLNIDIIVGMATKALPFVQTRWQLLLYVTAPFNVLKGVVLGIVTFLLYKSLSPLLHVRGQNRA